ncbi:Glycerol-3-phosphate ABC transporter, ATP-binding protein UgpC (TC 3.A.1.1.3) [hydrothermal vent metagenome]|uniref:Glycerol-3-phosphate ABC transporter, ATP-binding protein UgpC (TC 3.A.1.1.3) n=1 Tax=hydrothermal vent metagenome TaxID=652676 RepID=A0A3B0S5Y2_9ZZZZ
MAGIRLERLTKRYGPKNVVDGIDLEIEEGQFTVLVGPSGCGKTTSLRMIAGLVEPTSGRIFIGDRDVTDLEPKDRNIAMVFQNYALYPHLSVRDNISFGLRARKKSKAVIDERVEYAANLLNVEELLDRKPGELSGGQQQRVAIGRAIVREPEVFLFDEPLSNLDAKLRVEMRTELLRLQRALGATMVYVTHDQEESMALADELVVMNAGSIQQRGRPQDVYDHPTNTFVSTFIGSPAMNLIEGEIAHGVYEGRGIRITALDGLPGPVTLGVRPEHIHFIDDLPKQEATESFEALVDVIEPLGARAVLSLRVGGSQPLRAVVDSRWLGGLVEGEFSEFVFDRNRLHFFR